MFRLACLSIGRINSVNLSLGRNHYSSLIQRKLSTTSIGWQKQSNTAISSSESSGKKYTRPPPIDLKSVRTNQALGNDEEKSGRGKTSVLGAIFLLTIPLLTFGLGVWQVKRRQEKLDLIAFLKSRTDSQPVELPSDPKQLDNLLVENEYRPFKLRGHFLHSREILLTMRHDLSQHTHVPGGQVITPFVLSSNPNIIVLVNRGFVPYTHFSPVSRTQSQVEGEVEVVGLLRSNEPINTFTPVNIPPNEWHYRDIDLMAKTLDTKPIFLDALSTTGLKSDNYPLPKQTAIQLRNDHLMYLITWFSLSLITSALWWRRFKSLLIRVKP